MTTMMDFLGDCFNAVVNGTQLPGPCAVLDLEPCVYTFVQCENAGVLTVTMRLSREVAERRFYHLDKLLGEVVYELPAAMHLRFHKTLAGAFTVVITAEKKV